MEKRKPTLREILSASVFIGVIGVLFVINLVIPSPEVLVSERRMPARFPDLNINAIMTGAFMSQFEDYAADHFVQRDTFRGINAFLIFEIYRQNDKSGLYRSSEVGLGQFYHMDESAISESSLRIKTAAESFNGLDMNIYYSIIPDKSIYAERVFPGFNAEAAERIVFESLGEYGYIRLIEDISAEYYYKTDIHWDQSMISRTVNKLLSGMNAQRDHADHPTVTVGEFKGVYSGQYALPYPPDIMSYVDVSGINVSYLNERTLEFEPGPVYEPASINGVDPYDVFLRGPQAIIILENEKAPSRELYLFRDSFSSSLAPLLTDAYSKITLIDLRYIHLSMLDQLIDFTPGSDVLFLYGSQILNSPSALRT